MTSKELANTLAEQLKITKKDSSELLSATITELREQLLKGNSVLLQNFGTLVIESKAARKVVHPRTGKTLLVPAKKKLVFHPNDKLKEAVKDVTVTLEETR